MDSCLVVPANVDEAITVAASDLDDKFNATQTRDPEDIYLYANTGSCVDIFAPGVDILAACGSTSKPQTRNARGIYRRLTAESFPGKSPGSEGNIRLFDTQEI
jgi:subtilisin family serine protease